MKKRVERNRRKEKRSTVSHTLEQLNQELWNYLDALKATTKTQ